MKKKGFTLIELLVVISIITLLLAIGTPAMFAARRTVSGLRQRCQLRDVEMGLEFWYNEQDNDYPDSEAQIGSGGLVTTGANHLAEALMGRDSRGFDSNSSWNADDDFGATPMPYDPTIITPDRENIYLDSEGVRGYQMAQIYNYSVDPTSTGDCYPGDTDDAGTDLSTTYSQAVVLTDTFTKKRIVMPESGETVKIGSPILYFKAKNTDIFNSTDYDVSVFNYYDNERIFDLGNNLDVAERHPFEDVGTGIDDFYNSLIDPKMRIGAGSDPIPYNRDSYILISAGYDGLYGTSDDVTNISKR